MMIELIDVFANELKRAADQVPSDREMSRTKAQLKAGLLMALESSTARAEQMARHLLSHDRILSSGELMQKVDDVTPELVRTFAMRTATSPPSIAVVGSGRNSHKYARHAEGIAGF